MGGRFKHIRHPPEAVISASSLLRYSMGLIVRICWYAVACPVTCQMPFADIGIFISCLFHIVCNCLDVSWEGLSVSVAAYFRRIFATLKYRPARPTYRLCCKCISKKHSLIRKSVKIRCYIKLLSITAHSISPLLVRKNENYIWLFHNYLRKNKNLYDAWL